jgi:hypothetical protein
MRLDHAHRTGQRLHPEESRAAHEHAVAPWGRPLTPHDVLALQRSAGNAAMVQRLTQFQQGHNAYTALQISDFVGGLAGPDRQPQKARELFRTEFPYATAEDVKRMIRVLGNHGPATRPAAQPGWGAGFAAHLTGGHFQNGGAGFHLLQNQMPAGATQVVQGPAYDGGAFIGTISRTQGAPVRSTFFPVGWTVADVQAAITEAWETARHAQGVVHVVRRGSGRFAIGVNITGGSIVSAFPAHRGGGGRWSVTPP